MTTRAYSYVGPAEIREASASAAPGTPVRSRAELEEWLGRNPEARTEGATFVVDVRGVLRLAPRRSEHVACAGGEAVRAAGEIRFATDQSLRVAYVSNQSTGYCPEPESFDAVAAALDAVGAERPAAYSYACVFRRCPGCGQKNLVKEKHFVCDACDGPLPLEWNFSS